MKFLRWDGTEGEAHFTEHFVFSQRLRGGAFVEVGFHEIRVQRERAVGEGDGVLMMAEAARPCKRDSPSQVCGRDLISALFQHSEFLQPGD